jgi:hypothetical protein
MAEAIGQEGPEPGLHLVGGREIRVPSFGLAGHVVLAGPDEEGFAEAGARRQNRDGRMLHRAAGIDDRRLLRQQIGHGMGDGLEVIEQADLAQAEIAGQPLFVEVPGQIGQMGVAVDHRPGHIEAGRGDCGALGMGRHEGFDDGLKPGEVLAGIILLGQVLAGPAFGRDQGQAGFRPADIAGYQHQLSSFRKRGDPPRGALRLATNHCPAGSRQ